MCFFSVFRHFLNVIFILIWNLYIVQKKVPHAQIRKAADQQDAKQETERRFHNGLLMYLQHIADVHSASAAVPPVQKEKAAYLFLQEENLLRAVQERAPPVFPYDFHKKARKRYEKYLLSCMLVQKAWFVLYKW